MAKKKRTRSRGRSKKSRSRKPKAKPAGMAGGVALTGVDMLTMSTFPYADPVTYIKAMDVPNIIGSLKANASLPKTYKYALAGLLISASPRIPVIGIVAGPADRGLKRLTKGKWGL